MLIEAVEKISAGEILSAETAGNLIEYMSTGKANPLHIAAFLTALKARGENTEELTGMAKKMREMAVKIDISEFEPVVDSCGTGGDMANTFNISTAVAIVAASSGLCVVKHSGRGVTGKSGSVNVAEALGIQLAKTAKTAEDFLKEHNIAFISAPDFHKSTFYVNNVRKELGMRTIFNFLGPLTNPACPTGQVVGVSVPEIAPKIAETLKNLGCKKALVVCGISPVLDEISVCGETLIFRLENGIIDKFTIKPEDFGFNTANLVDIAGDTPEFNAQIIRGLLSGEIQGAKLDILLLNTAALLWVGEKAKNFEEGINIAKELIISGKALGKFIKICK